MKVEVINRFDTDNVIGSNFVYPTDLINQIAVVDKKWLQEQMKMLLGAPRNSCIANKYLIDVNGRYYYKHDNCIWLVEFKTAIEIIINTLKYLDFNYEHNKAGINYEGHYGWHFIDINNITTYVEVKNVINTIKNNI